MTDNNIGKDLESPKYISANLTLSEDESFNTDGLAININDFIDPEYIVSPFEDSYIAKEFFGKKSTIYSKNNVKLLTIEHNLYQKVNYNSATTDVSIGLDYLVIIPSCIIFSIAITAIRYKFFKKKK
jgi:hypothetical protein